MNTCQLLEAAPGINSFSRTSIDFHPKIESVIRELIVPLQVTKIDMRVGEADTQNKCTLNSHDF
jgi:hypothetical protein